MTHLHLSRLFSRKPLPQSTRHGSRPRSAAHGRCLGLPLCLERLEDRTLLDVRTARWIGGDGVWSDPTKWDIGVVPNNSGDTTYHVILDRVEANPVITLDRAVTISRLSAAETLRVAAGTSSVLEQTANSGTLQVTGASARFTLSGTVTNTGNASALEGALQFSAATVANAGRTITADRGIVEIANSTISGGSLLATDNPASFVQFVGDVTLTSVTWQDPGAGEFRVYQTGARLLGDFAQRLPAGYTLVVQTGDSSNGLSLGGGVFTNDGTIEVRGPWFPGARNGLHVESNMLLTGTGRVLLAGPVPVGPYWGQLGGAPGVRLTVGPSQSLRGAGTITVGLVNQGLIESNVVGQTLTVSGFTENAGTLRIATGSGMTLSSGVANTGTLDFAAGGALTLGGNVSSTTEWRAGPGTMLRFDRATVPNAGRTVTADRGVVEIANSIITGGSLQATDSPASFVQFAGNVTFNGVTWQDPGAGEFRVVGTATRFLGDFAQRLPAGYTLVIDGCAAQGFAPAQLTLGGVLTNDGTIEVRGLCVGARLVLESNTVLTGTGQVRLEETGSDGRAEIGGDAAVTLTVASGQALRGRGGIRTRLVNQGLIEATAGQDLGVLGTVLNTGTVRAAGDSRVELSGGFTNTGTLEIGEGGTLTLRGPVSSSAEWRAGPGARLRFDRAAVPNAGRTITADRGIVEITNSTVTGGSLRTTDNEASSVLFAGNVTLDGVAWQDPGAGEFQVVGSATRFLGDYAQRLPAGYTLVVEAGGFYQGQLILGGGGFTNDGTIEVRGSAFGGRGTLYLEANTLLTGSGFVRLRSGQVRGAAGVTLSVGSSQTIRGEGTATISCAVQNAGIIRGVGEAHVMLSGGVTNTGTLEVASGGTLTVGGNVSNTAAWRAGPGTTLRFDRATVPNSGRTITADRGIVEVANSTLTGGNLLATDDAASFVQFAGNVTLTGVAWQDPGAGEFRVAGATARLLGDYAQRLPVGNTLVIERYGGFFGSGAQLIVSGGTFTNDGTIEVRGGFGSVGALYLETNTLLTGNGQVRLSGGAINGTAGGTLTVGPMQAVRGGGSITVGLVNQGLLEATAAQQVLSARGMVQNTGTVRAGSGGHVELLGGVTNSGTLELGTGGTLTVGGNASSTTPWRAGPGSTLRFDRATISNAGRNITADRGTVEVSNSTITGGSLLATDQATSFVQFAGNVTLNNVIWQDPGEGEFRVFGVTARLLGDYAQRLPAGYTLVIAGGDFYSRAQLTLGGGTFTNDGTIEIRSGFYGYEGLHLEGNTLLTGSGQVRLSGGSQISGAAGATLTVGQTQAVRGGGSISVGLVNQGLLEATAAQQVLAVRGMVLNTGTVRATGGGQVELSGGVGNTGTLEIGAGGTLTVGGNVSSTAAWRAGPGATLRFDRAVVPNAGRTITADRGIVEIVNSTITGGSLLATDEEASFVQFAGNVTLNGVTWQDPGDGEFRVFGATARLLGDYAQRLPAGYTLVIGGGGYSAQLTFGGGAFTNDGTIEVRSSFCCEAVALHLETNTVLTGSGQVRLSGRAQISGTAGVTLTVGPMQAVRGSGSITVSLVNRGLMETAAQQVLTVRGMVQNTGTLRAMGGGRVELSGGLTNSGTLDIGTGGTLTVGGNVSNTAEWRAGPGATLRFDRATVPNAGRTITADRGIVEIANSIVIGGSLRVTDNAASFVQFAGDVTLNGVTWQDLGAGEFRVFQATMRLLGDFAQRLPAGYTLVIQGSGAQLTLGGGEFTNDGTIEVRNSDFFSRSRLYIDANTLLTGSGRLVLSSVDSFTPGGEVAGRARAALTIGPSQVLRGKGTVSINLINQGLIEATVTDQSLTLAALVTNQGAVQAVNGGTLVTTGAFQNDGSGVLAGQPSGTLAVRGHLLGNTRNADLYAPVNAVRFEGTGTAAAPQLFEVMGQARGAVATGFRRNFVYDTLVLANNTYVRLVDQFDNAPGAGPEALYVTGLVVPAGTTLHLNGLWLYTRGAQVSGTILGGTWVEIPDSGPILLGVPTPAAIARQLEVDAWTFFGRANRAVTVVVDPGSNAVRPPVLTCAQVQLRDSQDVILATADNNCAGDPVRLNGVALPRDGTYRIHVRSTPAQPNRTGNYLVTYWDVTPNVRPLNFNQQFAGHIVGPFSVDRWTFSAVAGQQVRFDLVNVSSPGIVFDLRGPNNWTGFEGLTGSSGLISLPSSGGYVLTARGTGGQTGTYAFRLVETAQVSLTLGTTYTGRFVGSGQAQLFRVRLDASSPLRVNLDDSSTRNQNELYLKFGIPPTRSDYDYTFSAAASPDQQVLVSAAAAGTWYVLVYGDLVVDQSSYTLAARTSDVMLRSVTPERHGNNAGSFTMTLTGAGFEATTIVELVSGVSTSCTTGTAYRAASAEADSFTQLTARFTFAPVNIPVGRYTVRVRPPVGSCAELPTAFEVRAGGQPNLQTNLVVPGAVRERSLETLYVDFANTGDLAMPAPLLVVRGTGRALLTLDSSRVVPGFWTSARPDGFSDTVQILASGNTPGLLQPGESFRVPVYYIGLEQPWDPAVTRVDFTLGVLTTENTSPLNWPELCGGLRPPIIRPDAWDAICTNLIAQVGQTWGDYVRMLNDNATYLGRLGQRVLGVGQLLGFEVQQADGLSPLRYLTSSVDAAIAAPGMALTFGRVFVPTISRRYEVGPLGRGWFHTWQMSIQRENDGTAVVTGIAGSQRRFQPDTRGGFFSMGGDRATLVHEQGVYRLRESDGTLFVFRTDGMLNYVEDPNGNRITATYVNGRLTHLTHSNESRLELVYTPQGRLDQVREVVNNQVRRTTTYGYDPTGEYLRSVTDARGTTRYTYETGVSAPRRHALLSIEYPGRTFRFFGYDTRGRLQFTHRGDGVEQLNFEYDSAGKISIRNLVPATSEFFFNHRGLIVKVRDPLGSAVHLTFDNDYNLTRVTDAAGRFSSYGYDALGNLTAFTDALGYTTRFAYAGPFNRLTIVTDAKGNSTQHAYDDRGNLRSTTYPNGSLERLGDYDAQGNPRLFTNRRGEPIRYEYDTAGRVRAKIYADSSLVTYIYNPRGLLESATDATGTTRLDYYPNTDRLRRITYPGARWLEFTYNPAGQRETSTDQLGYRLTYQYDAVGRLERITDSTNAQLVRYHYDRAGRLERKVLGNGVYTIYEYDVANQLRRLINRKPDNSILSRFEYEYDSRGRRTSMTTLEGTWRYDYDDAGQLVGWIAPNGRRVRYVYDAMGNRVTATDNGVTTAYTTNNMNQYTDVGGVRYTYDTDGNLVNRVAGNEVTTYQYDAENRLIGVVRGNDQWTYTYDALDNRVATTHNGVTTRFVIDPIGLGDVVGEYNAAGNVVARYTHGFGLLSRTEGVGNAAYYTFDAIGSTSELTNPAGLVANSYTYEPFGALLRRSETIANRFTYVGEFGVVSDGDGQQYMRARYYRPELGIFLSEDPIRVAGKAAHIYVDNNPLSLIDPTGLQFALPSFHRHNLERLVLPPPIVVPPNRPPTNSIQPDSISIALDYEPDDGPGPGDPKDKYEMKGPDFDLSVLLSDVEFPPRPGSPVRREEAVESTVLAELMNRLLPRPPAQTVSSSSSPIVRAIDPNEKTGPAGFGPRAFVALGNVIPYRIDFENDNTASAPAQRVDIVDQLSNLFDWSTFRLTEIGFGDIILRVPDGSQSFRTVVSMTYNGVTFEVHVEAGIRAATGQVFAIFQSIDPATGLPPPALIGFLPPENGTGRGMGYVNFVIRARSNLTSGTEIRNIAFITFDSGETIATNQRDPHRPELGTDPNKEARITLDALPPIRGRVLPLPAVTTSRTFTVRWTGEDDAGGAGVGRYDVFVSRDGGNFTAWLTNTALSTADFTGAFGRTYRFYAVPIDNTGQRMGVPPQQDWAFTRLVGPAVRFGVVASVNPATAGTPFNITVTALDEGSGVASGYQGTVCFTSNDPQATLPACYTFLPADNGVRTFSVTLRTAGDRIITVRDNVMQNITGNVVVPVIAAAASTLALSCTASVIMAGTPVDCTVTARDSYGNTATSYRGTVRFSSSDGVAVLPPNYPFTAADNGVRRFQGVVLRTAGDQTVTTTDTVNGSLTATARLRVLPLVSFYPVTTYPVGSRPYHLAVGDFNSDGILDIAAANQGSDSVSILLGNGDGTFLAVGEYSSGGSTPYAVLSVDFNGDEVLDLAVANGGSDTVAVLLGIGDGTFQEALLTPVDVNPQWLAAGDVNLDGAMDLVTANFVANTYSVLLGAGDGTFISVVHYPAIGQGANAVTLADVNMDGFLDLVLTYYQSNNVSVQLGNGDGTFGEAQTYGVGTIPVHVVVGDLNGDGVPDLAVANQGSGTVSVLLGVGDGTFRAAVHYLAGPGAINVRLADFNADGVLDLATANYLSGQISVLLGLGDGTFLAPVVFEAGLGPVNIAVADFNGDGLPDLAAANLDGDTIGVLLNGDGRFGAPGAPGGDDRGPAGMGVDWAFLLERARRPALCPASSSAASQKDRSMAACPPAADILFANGYSPLKVVFAEKVLTRRERVARPVIFDGWE